MSAPPVGPLRSGVYSTGAVLGATLAAVLGGYLEMRVGWRHAMGYFALAGGLLALLMYATLREPMRVGATRDEIASPAALRTVVKHLLSLNSYVLVVVAVCFAMLVEFGLNQWLPSYYVRQFSLTLSDVGFRYGLAVAFGGIPGSILGGLIATYLTRRDIRWLVWFPAAMYSVALPLGLARRWRTRRTSRWCSTGYTHSPSLRRTGRSGRPALLMCRS